MNWKDEHDWLREAGFEIVHGLSEVELQRVERSIGSELPPDLRQFLAEGVPKGPTFPDWREPESAAIREQLDWPFEGIAFDIEQSSFWWDDWGPRPTDVHDAIALARRQIAAAPCLVPLMGHRYIPAEPATTGNPVFSVYQTDIIYYGCDLTSYLRCELRRASYAEAVTGPMRKIRFWSDLVEANE